MKFCDLGTNGFGERVSLKSAAVLLAAAAAVPTVARAAGGNLPITATGWDRDLVSEQPVTSSASAFDLPNNYAFYSAGSNSGTPGGLPANGTIQSAANAATLFQLQPYTGSNALFFNTNANYTQQSTGALTFANPTAFTSLAILDAAANGLDTVNFTINYSDNTTASYALVAQDWFNNTPYAIAGLGRVSLSTNTGQLTQYLNATDTNPRLYEYDFTVPTGSTTKRITGISFASPAGQTASAAIFAVSGTANLAGTGTSVWRGNVNGTWDQSTANWSTGVFTNDQVAQFDDTATGTTNITVAPAGVVPANTLVNSSLAYTFGGGTVGGYGGITKSGTGTLTINNAFATAGDTLVNAGTLTVGATGAINDPYGATNVVVAGGAVLNLLNGSNLGGQTFSGSTLSLTVNGVANLDNTRINVLSGTSAGRINTGASGIFVTGGNFPGTIAGGGQVTFNGSTTVTGTNTYTGATTFNTGAIVSVNGAPNLGTGPLLFDGGGLASTSAALTGTAAIPNPFSGGLNDLSAVFSGNYAIELSGPGSLGSGYTAGVVVNNPITTFSGPVAFTIPMLVSGTGTLVLSGSNTFVTAASITSTTTLQINSPASIAGLGSILVRGAALVVNDNSGLTGAGTQLTINAVSAVGSATVYGTLRGPDNATGTWAGSVVSPNLAYITGGANGTLNVNGSISGVSSSPFQFSSNPNSTTVLNGANQFTGETDIKTAAASTTATLVLGNDAALTGGGGFNSGGGFGNATLDLNGHPATFGYLVSNNPTDKITNGGATTSTLTVTNNFGFSVAPPVFAGRIIDGLGKTALLVNGSTPQLLAGANTYSGGTTIQSGTLGALTPAALGTGAVTLSGGVLSVGGGYVLTGGPSVSGNAVRLTDGVANELRAAFVPAPVTITNAAGFTASFVYTATGSADGVAFVVQNDPRGAYAVSSTGGGSFGYGGTNPITNSGAVELNLYTGAAGGAGTAFGTNGSIPTNTSVSPVSLASGHPILVSLNYFNGTLSEIVTDQTTQQRALFNYTVNFQTLLNGTSGYVGFTGATGGLAATQTISNFQFTSGSNFAVANPITVPANSSSTLQVNSFATNNQVQTGSVTLAAGSTLAVAPSTGLATNSAYSAVLTGPLGFGTGGTISVANNGTGGGRVNVSSVTDFNAPGRLSFTGPGEFSFTGTGGVTTPGTVLSADGNVTLDVTSATALGSAEVVNISSGSVVNFTPSTTIGGLTGVGSATLYGTALNVAPATRTTFAGSLTAPLVGGSLAKTGSSVFVDTGSIAIGGQTIVNAGTLELDGTLASSNLLYVFAGGTLAGVGTISAPVDVSGSSTAFALLSPGATSDVTPLIAGTTSAVGTFTATSVRFDPYGELAIDISGSTSDLLVDNTFLTLTSSDVLALTGAFDGTTTYTIARYGTTLTGTFAAVTGLPANYAVNYGTGSNSAITLVPVAVPEPATVAIAVASAAALIGRRRREAVAKRTC